MGANLIPIVRNFIIQVMNIPASHCAVQEGCTVPGNRKLLRFDFLCWNAGNKDVAMGNPAQNPQLYEYSPCHGHYHLRDFNGFKLYDCKGLERIGSKQAFCLMDLDKIDPAAGPAKFSNCNSNQGVSAGWADVYNNALDCQWVDITGVPDGDYVLEAFTNRNGVVKEDWYGDNFTWAGVRVKRNTVQQIPVPCYPEDCLSFNPKNVTAKKIAGSWKVVDGNHWMLDFGSKQKDAKKAVKIIKFYGMNRICFVGRPAPGGKQLMMYFKINDKAPVGSFLGEDAVPFSNFNVSAQFVTNRWKVVDGSHWILDFGISEANARKAVWLIKKYGFNDICFVGRPNPPMMYFRV